MTSDVSTTGWVVLPQEGRLVHVEDGWLIRRTYVVGQPGEIIERYVSNGAKEG